MSRREKFVKPEHGEKDFVARINNDGEDGVSLIRELQSEFGTVNVAFGPYSLLFFAIATNRPDVVRYLLENGVQESNWRFHKQIPEVFAVVTSQNCELVELLVTAGFNVDSPNIDRSTALIDAIQAERFEIAKCLVNFGASLDSADRWGRTAKSLLNDKGREL